MDLPTPRVVHRLGPKGKTAQLRAGVIVSKRSSNERKFITPQFALVYVVAGEGWYEDTLGERYDLHPGCFFLRYPNKPHRVHIDAPSVRAYIAVPSQAYELLRICQPHKVDQPVHDIGLDWKLVAKFEDICEQLIACGDADLYVALGMMQQFIGELFSSTVGQRRRELDPRMEQACKVLGDNFSTRIQLDDVARSLNMSKSAFRKKFRETHGLPPGEYRIRRRIEKAMNLLSMDVSLSEISVQLGYTDVFAFSAQFKKYVGSSPSALRKTMR